jgi:hypothetical protein
MIITHKSKDTNSEVAMVTRERSIIIACEEFETNSVLR